MAEKEEKENKENRWFFYYIPLIGGIVCAMQMVEQGMTPKSTYIIGVFATITTAILIWIGSRPLKFLVWEFTHTKEKWRKTHAFIFIPDKEHKKVKKIKLPIGRSSHLFWIKSYKAIELKGFTIRFVPTKGINSKCKQTPSSVIEIKKVELKWDSTDITVHKDKNHILEKEKPIGMNEPSKWHCWFDGGVISSLESPIGIKIVVDAKTPWKGYFSIESRSQKRCYGRIKIKVTNN